MIPIHGVVMSDCKVISIIRSMAAVRSAMSYGPRVMTSDVTEYVA